MKPQIKSGLTLEQYNDMLSASPRPEEQDAQRGEHPKLFDPEALVLWVDGKPIAAGGLWRMSPSIRLVWLAASTELFPYRRLIVKTIWWVLDEAQKHGERVHAFVSNDNSRAARFAQHFGLKPVAIGSHYTLYRTT